MNRQAASFRPTFLQRQTALQGLICELTSVCQHYLSQEDIEKHAILYEEEAFIASTTILGYTCFLSDRIAAVEKTISSVVTPTQLCNAINLPATIPASSPPILNTAHTPLGNLENATPGKFQKTSKASVAKPPHFTHKNHPNYSPPCFLGGNYEREESEKVFSRFKRDLEEPPISSEPGISSKRTKFASAVGLVRAGETNFRGETNSLENLPENWQLAPNGSFLFPADQDGSTVNVGKKKSCDILNDLSIGGGNFRNFRENAEIEPSSKDIFRDIECSEVIGSESANCPYGSLQQQVHPSKRLKE